jgi:hypothetical protein
MSAEAITDAVARHFEENVEGIRAAYASGAGEQGVKTLPGDVFTTPIALVYWQNYSLTAGSYERIRHTIHADVYFQAADPAMSYKTYLPMVTKVIASFRTNVGLFGTATLAQAVRGGSPEDVVINGKPYIRLTFEIEALEASPQAYALGAP